MTYIDIVIRVHFAEVILDKAPEKFLEERKFYPYLKRYDVGFIQLL